MRRTVVITPEPRPYTCTIRVCDLCGKESRPGEYLDDGGGLYDRPEVTIEGMFGDVWPNGDDDRTTTYLDVCPPCFRDRFVPAVETALGIKFHRDG